MKLNKKGWEMFYKWENVYYDELEKQRAERNDPDWFEGWCIIEDDEHCPTIEDYVGLMVYGDDDSAIWNILENFRADEQFVYGYTAQQVVEMLKPYYDIDEDEDLSFRWGDANND